MVDAFRHHGLGQVLDFVPNHMGVGGADNLWWLDVLEWGPDSAYAGWFDIDWDPDQRYLAGKLLVPFLGDQYGAVLEAGQLDCASTRRMATSPSGPTMRTSCRSARCIMPASWATPIRSWNGWATRSAGLPNWRPQRPAARARPEGASSAGLVRERDDVRQAVEVAVARVNGEAGDLQTGASLTL